MKKNLIIICNLACLICFFIVLMGCDQPDSKPATPKIVRKKIRQQPDRTAAAPEAQTAKRSQPQPKSEMSVIQTPKAPAVADKTESDKPATPSTDQAAIAKSSSQERPIYNPKDKVDPFEPLFRDKPTVALVKKKRKKRVPRTPLEKIDLSQLRLVGIIVASSGNRALVEESSGKGYVIKSGTYVGTNAGKVVKIEKDKVVVAEEYEDVLGNVSLRNKELTLPKPPGEF